MVACVVPCSFVFKQGVVYSLAQGVMVLCMVLDVTLLLSMIPRQLLKVRGTCCTGK